MIESFHYMRLRKAPYTEFKRVSTSLDDFSFVSFSPIFLFNRVPMMDLELKENDLISFMNPVCPQCSSKNVVKNGTFFRTMENGITFRMQRYICSDCRYSFVARPPNYGYGKHFSHDMQNKSMKSRVKTSLRKAASLFRITGDTIISHETVRRLVPPLERSMMKSSGYFVYDEQYVHIDCVVKYRSVLKDSKTGNFVEEILDDLQESTLTGFFIRSIGMFNVTGDIFMTTDGYHYESSLIETGRIMGKRIRRQRCLFHIEKELAPNIKGDHKEKELEHAKRLVKYTFFQNETNLKKPGKNKEAVLKLTDGRNESEKVDLMLGEIESLYGEYRSISKFLDFIRKHRNEVFLYIKNPEVEKTSDKAEQHFSIQSWLFKNRFKTKDGLLRTSYWYHRCLSTEM